MDLDITYNTIFVTKTDYRNTNKALKFSTLSLQKTDYKLHLLLPDI